MLNCLLTIDLGLIIGLVIGAIAIIAVIALVSFFIGTYNGLIQVKNLVEEAWATIDVQLKKRYDLIPNLVETVKGYAAHESKTLESVIAARNLALQNTPRCAIMNPQIKPFPRRKPPCVPLQDMQEPSKPHPF